MVKIQDKEMTKVVQRLNETDEKIDELSNQLVWLKHEYRRTRDGMLKAEIKKKWDKLQKKMDTLEKRRRKIIEKKNEINYKRKWTHWKKDVKK